MIKFKNIDDAIEKAKEISKLNLKSISIVQRNNSNDEFIVCDKGGADRKAHDKFIKLITNFESPFGIESHSPKSGVHFDYFPKRELADDFYNRLVKEKYRTSIRKNYI